MSTLGSGTRYKQHEARMEALTAEPRQHGAQCKEPGARSGLSEARCLPRPEQADASDGAQECAPGGPEVWAAGRFLWLMQTS